MTASPFLWAPAPPSSLPVAGTDKRFPVSRIFCVGRNYHAHALEMNSPVDKAKARPFYFLKDPSALVESGATIAYPPGTANYHYEMELVVAVGAKGFRVSEADAGRLVYGYAAGLDMTRRDLQMSAREQGRPWDLGKNFENSAICSPITPQGKLDVLAAGTIELSVNGATRQSADISQLIWSIPELLADLSQFYHLQPGDLIYTGTPEGVGAVNPGDSLEGSVAGVGAVRLTIGKGE
jgi:fumarylpyruvate hydrolase